MPYDQRYGLLTGYQMEVVTSSHERLDRRSLAMHRLIADKIRAEPELFEIASQNIERWMRTSGRHDHLLLTWSRLLRLGMTAALLRQSTPFAGVLSPQERWSFLRKWNATNSNT